MSITTYTELKTAVESWLEHQLFTSRVPDFITLFEATANRRLRVRQQETASQLTTSSGEASLPTDYLQHRHVTWVTSGGVRRELDYVTPVQLNEMFPTLADGGEPAVFTIVGEAFAMRPGVDTGTTFLAYYQKIPVLSDSNTTNWLLTAHPDLYLFGSLVEAELFGVNDERFPIWKARRDEIFNEIEILANKSRGGGSIRIKGPTP